MLFDVTDPFCTPILRGIENALYPLAYLPIFADAHNQRDRFERYLEMLLERHVDGLIVVANWLFVDIDVLADLRKREVLAATIGWELPEIASAPLWSTMKREAVRPSNICISAATASIAIIRGPKRLIDTAPRWRGIQKFAQSVKLGLDPALTLQLPDVFDATSSFEYGYRLTEELLLTKEKVYGAVGFRRSHRARCHARSCEGRISACPSSAL